MQATYSIVQARNNFATLVRDAEDSGKPVEVTRRGQSVAVILSIAEYERLTRRPDFAARYAAWRADWAVDTWEDEDIWEDVRDKSAGREENPWL